MAEGTTTKVDNSNNSSSDNNNSDDKTDGSKLEHITLKRGEWRREEKEKADEEKETGRGREDSQRREKSSREEKRENTNRSERRVRLTRLCLIVSPGFFVPSSQHEHNQAKSPCTQEKRRSGTRDQGSEN